MVFEKFINFERFFPWFSLILGILGIVILIVSEQHAHVPTFIVACVAMWFSFFAYKFSKERFRLELFDRRWEIYLDTLKFCSMVIQFGVIPRHSNDKDKNQEVIEGLIAAEGAFRGIGYHKSKSLLGEDINEYFERLNKAYSWLWVHNDINYNRYSPEDFERESEYLEQIFEVAQNLPDLFKPYVYFGDYKND